MKIRCRLMVLAVLGMGSPMSADATITFASDEVRAAAAAPEIAAVLAAHERVTAAILGQDVAGFAVDQAPELVVNSPANRVLTGPMTVGAFRAGLINYASIEQTIEYAAVRPNGEVLLMGHEVVTPRGATRNSGHTQTYRVTEIWRPDAGRWLMSVRQATIVEVK